VQISSNSLLIKHARNLHQQQTIKTFPGWQWLYRSAGTGTHDEVTFSKEIVSRGWGGLLMVLLDRFKVQSISRSNLFLIYNWFLHLTFKKWPLSVRTSTWISLRSRIFRGAICSCVVLELRGSGFLERHICVRWSEATLAWFSYLLEHKKIHEKHASRKVQLISMNLHS
jgi:hypothetical protein